MGGVDWDTALAQAASDVTRRFYGYVARDDLLQEAWYWRLSHPGTIDGYEADEQDKRAQYRLRRDLIWTMEKYARKEKASTLGYDPNDEAFYSESLVAAALPSVLHGDTEQPTVESDGRGATDPAEGGTWLAHLNDVARAWNSAPLSERERAALLMFFGLGKSQEQIAEVLGVVQATVHNRITSGMKKLIGYLGGEKPHDCPYNCECHEGKLRVRPGVHSEISGKNQELR